MRTHAFVGVVVGVILTAQVGMLRSDPGKDAEADLGRHPGFPSFDVVAGGPGSFAERSAWEYRCSI